MQKWSLIPSLLAPCLLLCPTMASADLSGSVHDFSSRGWSGGKLCEPCHTPHDADTSVPDAPLWNHAVSTATYTLYSSPTMQATPEQPRSESKLCLSCHDGTIALDSYGGQTGSDYVSSDALIGTTLSDDHPLSIQWLHQNELSNGMCLECHSLHPSAFISELPFFDGYIECPTCHNVHNSSGNPKLLRMSMDGSELCFHCHGK